MRNHLGSYECKLCLTLRNNEGNYLAHPQGKRHQTNLAKRAARDAKEAPAQPQPHKRKVSVRKTVKIGRPGYRVTEQYDPETNQRSLLFQIEYPEIEDLTKPRHPFMSSYEQRECNPLIRGISIFCAQLNHMKSLLSRFPAQRLISQHQHFSRTGTQTQMFTLQLYFKPKPPEAYKPQPPSTANSTAAPGVLKAFASTTTTSSTPRLTTWCGEPLGNPPRAPPPLIPVSLLPPPPMSNGPRSAPPVGSSTTASFNMGTRPPPMLPGQGFLGPQMQGLVAHPPPPPPPIMGQ